MSERLTLSLSEFADPIAKQLRAQKFRFDKEEVKQFQRILAAIETLYWNDFVKDTTKLKEKLYAQVMRHVKKMNPPTRKARNEAGAGTETDHQ